MAIPSAMVVIRMAAPMVAMAKSYMDLLLLAHPMDLHLPMGPLKSVDLEVLSIHLESVAPLALVALAILLDHPILKALLDPIILLDHSLQVAPVDPLILLVHTLQAALRVQLTRAVPKAFTVQWA